MLKYLKIKNFLSFSEETTFSMEANLSKDRSMTDNIFTVNGEKLLKTTAIYWPNSSWKTNLFRAFHCLKELVVNSHNYSAGQSFPNLQPFLLKKNSSLEPIEFEVSFLMDGYDFLYQVKLFLDHVYFESLYRVQWNKKIKLFERKEQKIKLHNAFDDKGMSSNVKENSLAVSVYSTRNAEIPKKIVNFFNNMYIFIGGTSDLDTFNMLNKDGKFKHFLSWMLSDSGIKKVEHVTEEKLVGELDPELKKTLLDKLPPSVVLSPEHKIKLNQAWFVHNVLDEQGNVVWEVVFGKNQESMWTGRLFDLLWSIYDVVYQGKILLIDELDSSLHTELVKKLIHVLHKKSLHFQIIFNTHDTNLLDIDELFRKDQIWFAEKDPVKGTSKLVRLSDKKIRKDMVVEKNYLKWKLGALPIDTEKTDIL